MYGGLSVENVPAGTSYPDPFQSCVLTAAPNPNCRFHQNVRRFWRANMLRSLRKRHHT
jgi:hypothetical protein